MIMIMKTTSHSNLKNQHLVVYRYCAGTPYVVAAFSVRMTSDEYYSFPRGPLCSEHYRYLSYYQRRQLSDKFLELTQLDEDIDFYVTV